MEILHLFYLYGHKAINYIKYCNKLDQKESPLSRNNVTMTTIRSENMPFYMFLCNEFFDNATVKWAYAL
jgi:hypothetical protein